MPNCAGENLDLLAAPGGAVVWIMPGLSQLMLMKHLQARNIPQLLINREFAGFDCITTNSEASIEEGVKWLTSFGDPICLIAEKPCEWLPYQHGRLLAFFQAAVKNGIKLLPSSLHIKAYSTDASAMPETGKRLWGGNSNTKYNIFVANQELLKDLLKEAEKYGATAGKDFKLLVVVKSIDIRFSILSLNGNITGVFKAIDGRYNSFSR
jgi:DNA-binding LacI/PurR family transcriptional regulator